MYQSDSITRLIRLMPIASKDATRYHLNGVAISRATDTEILMEVTDGHRLVRETVKDEILAPLLIDGEKLIIFREQLSNLKNAIAFSGIDRTNKLLLFPGGAVGFDNSTSYPNTKQLEPDEKNYTHKIGFNAQYILDLAKALKDGKVDGVCLHVKFGKDKSGNETNVVLDPMIVKVGHRKAVLMPMRV